MSDHLRYLRLAECILVTDTLVCLCVRICGSVDICVCMCVTMYILCLHACVSNKGTQFQRKWSLWKYFHFCPLSTHLTYPKYHLHTHFSLCICILTRCTPTCSTCKHTDTHTCTCTHTHTPHTHTHTHTHLHTRMRFNRKSRIKMILAYTWMYTIISLVGMQMCTHYIIQAKISEQKSKSYS